VSAVGLFLTRHDHFTWAVVPHARPSRLRPLVVVTATRHLTLTTSGRRAGWRGRRNCEYRRTGQRFFGRHIQPRLPRDLCPPVADEVCGRDAAVHGLGTRLPLVGTQKFNP
jgi:hypothetical protein